MKRTLKLKCVSGIYKDREWNFSEKKLIKIGRENENVDIVIIPRSESELSISRNNTAIYISSEGIMAGDMGSSYGTWVNGVKIIGTVDTNQYIPEQPWIPLKNGDSLGMGLYGKSIVFQIITEENLSVLEDAYKKLEIILEQLRMEPDKADHTLQGDSIKEETIQNKNEDNKKKTSGMLNGYIEYKRLNPIGEGGQAYVYLGKNIYSGEIYAIKQNKNPLSGRIRKKYEREARIGMSLKHPNVVHTYHIQEVQEREGVFEIFMEYCEGGTLYDLVKKNGPMDIKEATEYMLQALDGLVYLHTLEYRDNCGEIVHGIVHRDIKPLNILLKSEGRKKIVKIGDYGLAKAYELAGKSGLTKTNETPLISPNYSSKNLIGNFKYTNPYVDVYSMAATYYYLLTDSAIRNEKNYAKYRNRPEGPWEYVLQEDVIPIRKRNPKIPEPLANIIDGILQEDSLESKQFTTAQEFRKKVLDYYKTLGEGEK